jgi:hypothetical protein
MFVVGGDGNMYALDLSTGETLSGWPVPVTTDPAHEHTYGAVNVSNGYAYAEVASYCDFTPYHGRVVAINLVTHQSRAFLPAGSSVSGGGIWGPGGVSIDPATGHVFAATGNALTNPESYRYSESVVELSATLHVLGANYPGLTGGDVDFGATPILYQPPGCAPMVAAKKTGVWLLMNEQRFRGPLAAFAGACRHGLAIQWDATGRTLLTCFILVTLPTRTTEHQTWDGGLLGRSRLSTNSPGKTPLDLLPVSRRQPLLVAWSITGWTKRSPDRF